MAASSLHSLVLDPLFAVPAALTVLALALLAAISEYQSRAQQQQQKRVKRGGLDPVENAEALSGGTQMVETDEGVVRRSKRCGCAPRAPRA